MPLQLSISSNDDPVDSVGMSIVISAVSRALRDFDQAGFLDGDIELSVTIGSAALTSDLRVGERLFTATAVTAEHLCVAIALQLQGLLRLGGREWPIVPGIGPLRPLLTKRRAMWTHGDGVEFQSVGHLFAREH